SVPRGRGRRSRPSAPRRSAGGSPLDSPIDSMSSHWRRIVAAVAALLVLWFLIALFQPFHGSAGDPVVVTIPKGASAGEVGDLLDDSGVVSSSTMFQIRVTLAGKRSELLPGTYTLNEGQTYGDAIEDLTTPAQERSTVTVTIPEGLSRAQIAPLAKQAGLTGRYVKASLRSPFLNPARYGAQGRARNLEGFLFPDTYQVKAGAPAADLVQLQVQNFKRRIKGVQMRYARSKNLTTYDVLIIASMIDREVQVPEERRLVAAVIYNRLSDGMPLGIDATTRFAVGNYTRPLTESELSDPSPYNTRLHAGLPPGPIGNPGLAAIQAAARPAKTDHLFYVVRPGTCGEHNFSSTEAEFSRDQAAYQRALEAKGGSPTSCPE
ncbi:MAG: endolytic transglycosylase MltG, partial [Solirubrobacterales bacterium]